MKIQSINCRGRLLTFDTPKVMGILNVTPDSFYDGGAAGSVGDRIVEMLEHGADIIDVGGMSSRPGASIISPEEEWQRVEPALKILRDMDTLVSIDTLHADVAQRAMDYGVQIINDISGGTYDPAIIDVAASHRAGYVMMHMKGTPHTMQLDTKYEDVVLDILKIFNQRIAVYRERGLEDIMIDVGFGFGKTLEQNYTLLNRMDVFRITECPILVGISRKSMIYKALQTSPSDALNGTTALHMHALQHGANVLRVHDVREAKECIVLHQLLKEHR